MVMEDYQWFITLAVIEFDPIQHYLTAPFIAITIVEVSTKIQNQEAKCRFQKA